MQGFVDAKGTGYSGPKIKMSNSKVAKFKGNVLELLTK